MTGLTRRTTCDDVIYALLAHDHNPNEAFSVHAFCIYERWRHIERPLKGRTKLLKVWRAWGAEKNNVQFLVRKVSIQIDGETPKRGGTLRNSKRHKKEKDHGNSSSKRGRKCTNHCSCCLEDKYIQSRAFQRLVAMVIENEKQLQDQTQRLRDTDKVIEEFEESLHEVRMQKHGYNYVVEAYMQNEGSTSSSDDSSDLFPAIKSNDLEAYSHICQGILEIEERIAVETEKIANLNSKLQEESFSTDSGHSSTLDNSDESKKSTDNSNTEVLKGALEQSSRLHSEQLEQLNTMQKVAEEYHKQLAEKQDYMQWLEKEVLNLEKEEDDNTKLVANTSNCSAESSNLTPSKSPQHCKQSAINIAPWKSNQPSTPKCDKTDRLQTSSTPLSDKLLRLHLERKRLEHPTADALTLSPISESQKMAPSEMSLDLFEESTTMEDSYILPKEDTASRWSGDTILLPAIVESSTHEMGIDVEPLLGQMEAPLSQQDIRQTEGHKVNSRSSIRNSNSPHTDGDSDTGVSSLHSDDAAPALETLV